MTTATKISCPFLVAEGVGEGVGVVDAAVGDEATVVVEAAEDAETHKTAYLKTTPTLFPLWELRPVASLLLSRKAPRSRRRLRLHTPKSSET